MFFKQKEHANYVISMVEMSFYREVFADKHDAVDNFFLMDGISCTLYGSLFWISSDFLGFQIGFYIQNLKKKLVTVISHFLMIIMVSRL